MMADRREPGWMQELRAKAQERFDAMSWPTTSDEEWRRTDVSGIDALSYVPIPRAVGSAKPGGGPRAGFAGTLRFDAAQVVESSIASNGRRAGFVLFPWTRRWKSSKSP